MKVQSTSLSGAFLIELDAYRDERGFFLERFNETKFQDLKIPGFPTHFIQDNFSLSAPRVIRGMHFQEKEPQAKLIGVTSGRVVDVAVDLRKDSPTYGKYFSVELDAEKPALLFIPEGFAHGFCVLGNTPAHVTYKVNRPYHAHLDRGIHCFDPDLAIAWPYRDAIFSAKDQALPGFRDYDSKGT